MKSEGYLTGIVYTPDPSCDSPEMPCGTPNDSFKLIIYEKESGALVTVAYTDDQGKYSLVLNPGSYNVTTSQGIYEVVIESGRTVVLNIHA